MQLSQMQQAQIKIILARALEVKDTKEKDILIASAIVSLFGEHTLKLIKEVIQNENN